MALWGILIVIAVLAVIILLSPKTSFKPLTRELFLRNLAEFLDGTIEPITEEGYANSFRVKFRFDGEECVYEDLEKTGFKDKVYSACLKVKTPSRLTVTFTEKKHSLKIRSDIFIASDVDSQAVTDRVKLDVPDYLKDLDVTANDVAAANALFEDKKVAGVLKKLKNADDRGYCFISLGITDGAVTLQFHAQNSFKPSLAALRNDMSSIEGHIRDVLVVVRKMKQLIS